jgi:hypothetical protein
LGLVFFLGNAFHTLRSGTLATAQEPLAKPPGDQTYVGSNQCASCHFDQYLAWKKTKHSKSFELLPAKYRTDSSCLKCHSTGHGQPTGYQGPSTAALAGTSCEACHGPGSKHGEIAKEFANKKLSKEQEAYVRSTIPLVLPVNTCTECHVSEAHKEHPPYDR